MAVTQGSETGPRHTLKLAVNGVFKGGGAKGLLYGGALQALAERGLWFRAVAGSSAGAITATLIASGLDAEEIIKEAPAGLRGVRRMLLADLVGSPLYRTAGLKNWLEGLLVRQVRTTGPTTGGSPVTFSELHTRSSIELYVVAVDVADRQPRVFSHHTSPDVSVTAAVLASSAIPMAFRPGRLDVRSMTGGTETHRMIDGGVWANYPDFVFRDPSFRRFHGIDDPPANSLTIGFTLDKESPHASGAPVTFKNNMLGATRDRGGFLPWLFRFMPMRLYFMTIVPLVVAAQFAYTVNAAGLVFLKDYATRDGVPAIVTRSAGAFDGFFSSFFPGRWLAITVLVVFGLVAAVLGGTLLDSGVPAMRTLMAVGTDVPYWVGADKADLVVRLVVPAGLNTTSFKLSDAELRAAVQSGRQQTGEQLSQLLSGSPGISPEC